MRFKNFEFPDELLYNNDYSWVKVDGLYAFVGVNDMGAKLVKQFVFVSLPKKSQFIGRGDVYVSLESIKWSGHLKSPVSGRVVDVNKSLIESPEIINLDPYGKGWIMKVELSDKNELNSLFSSNKLVEFLMNKNFGGV